MISISPETLKTLWIFWISLVGVILVLQGLVQFVLERNPQEAPSERRRVSAEKIADWSRHRIARAKSFFARVVEFVVKVIIIPLLTWMILMAMMALLEGAVYGFKKPMMQLWKLYSNLIDGVILVVWELPQWLWWFLDLIF